MGRPASDTTAAIIDGVSKFLLMGGFLTTALLAPNAVQILDKPSRKLLAKLDHRQQERELRRVVHYMKTAGLIRYTTWDYEHGIKLTDKGKQRLEQRSYDMLHISPPATWDKQWRLVFFDIPEIYKSKRNAFDGKLKLLGFKQLQISIWIHPFPSRAEIEAVCETLGIRSFVTYVEISHIDAESALRRRFKHLLST